jgi:hypothetical protein
MRSGSYILGKTFASITKSRWPTLSDGLRSRVGRLARSLSVRGFGRYLEQRFRVDRTFRNA